MRTRILWFCCFLTVFLSFVACQPSGPIPDDGFRLQALTAGLTLEGDNVLVEPIGVNWDSPGAAWIVGQNLSGNNPMAKVEFEAHLKVSTVIEGLVMDNGSSPWNRMSHMRVTAIDIDGTATVVYDTSTTGAAQAGSEVEIVFEEPVSAAKLFVEIFKTVNRGQFWLRGVYQVPGAPIRRIPHSGVVCEFSEINNVMTGEHRVSYDARNYVVYNGVLQGWHLSEFEFDIPLDEAIEVAGITFDNGYIYSHVQTLRITAVAPTGEEVVVFENVSPNEIPNGNNKKLVFDRVAFANTLRIRLLTSKYRASFVLTGVYRSPIPALRVVGNQIFYSKTGNPIRLRGVAVGNVVDLFRWKHQHIGFGPDWYLKDLACIADEWNANVVRIFVSPDFWANKREEVLSYLPLYIDAALAAGLFVVLDWHVNGFPDGFSQHGDTSMSTAIDFWDEISEVIQDRRVIFELWNEPIVTNNDYSNKIGPAWDDLKPYWELLIETIRANGSESMVLVSGNYWAFNLQGIKNNPLSDSNVAYAWHIYAGHMGNVQEAWLPYLDDLQQKHPVVVSEWGFSTEDEDENLHFYGSAENFGNAFRDHWLEEKGLHSIAWSFSPYDRPRFFADSKLATRTEWGQFVYEYYRSVGPVDRP